MSNIINETYKVESSNFDESLEVTFDLSIVDTTEETLHEINQFWAFSKERLSYAEGDIKLVICDLYATQLVYGYIHKEVWDDESANTYMSEREGFLNAPEFTIKNFNGEFDSSTKTTYRMKDCLNDQ